MADRGLRYWLQWPHSRRDHAIATVVFSVISVATSVTDALLASLVAAIIALVFATKVAWWEAGLDETADDAESVDHEDPR